MELQEALLTAGERTPGPSDYKADSRPTLPGKPAYTIAGRQSHAISKHSTPGPGAYAVRGNSKTVGSHPNAPGYSMPASGRPTLPCHRLPGPGGKSQFPLHEDTALLAAIFCDAPHDKDKLFTTHADRNTSSSDSHAECQQKQPSHLVRIFDHVQVHHTLWLAFTLSVCVSMQNTAQICTSQDHSAA